MSELRLLGRLAREPLYNTRAVVQTTGVPADTFRAWERRYGLPRPFRTSSNQRLYAERDIGVIGWLRERTDEGMTISQAIQRLRLEFPELFVADKPSESPPEPVQPVAESPVASLRQRLLDAFTAFDTTSADRVIDEGLARFSVEAFCAQLVEPVLNEVGVRWSRNELSVATEHFATRLLTRRLSAIFTIVSPVKWRGSIVAACPAGEEHELGLLVLAIALSRRGWRVVYLGANVPSGDLEAVIRTLRPDAVCLSVTTDRAISQAVTVAQTLRSGTSRPPVVLGGRAFTADGVSRMESVAHVVAGSAVDVADQIADLIERQQIGSTTIDPSS